ncbi:MAG: biotin/lipoyl-binding protein [Limisphaerales bacterium]
MPADVQAFVQATIHARASGYLKNWYVDIGDYVTNGQLLAEIDTPELNQQFAQAKAELDQAKAALDLAKITSDRWSELLKSASVSEQETAEKQSRLYFEKSKR